MKDADYDLARVVADPNRVELVPLDCIPAWLGRIEEVRAVLWLRLMALHVSASTDGPDHLLTIDEAAARLATTRDWLRRHHDLPFVVRLSEGQVRYSAQGVEAFIRHGRGA